MSEVEVAASSFSGASSHPGLQPATAACVLGQPSLSTYAQMKDERTRSLGSLPQLS